MEVSGQLHAPAALNPDKEALVCIGWKVWWPQSQSGPGDEEQKPFPTPARNQTLLIWPVGYSLY